MSDADRVQLENGDRDASEKGCDLFALSLRVELHPVQVAMGQGEEQEPRTLVSTHMWRICAHSRERLLRDDLFKPDEVGEPHAADRLENEELQARPV